MHEGGAANSTPVHGKAYRITPEQECGYCRKDKQYRMDYYGLGCLFCFQTGCFHIIT